MTTIRAGLCAAIAIVGLVLGGCAQAPVPASPGAKAEFVAAHKAKAKKLGQQGLLADALVAWRVLRAVDRDDADIARGLRSARSAVAGEAKKRRAAGDAAIAKGRPKEARRHYLSVLAVDPWDRDALRHLREIETKRLRQSNNTAVRESMTEQQASPSAPEPAPSSPDPKPAQAVEPEGSALDRGIGLFETGMFLESIRELEAYLGNHAGDTRARRHIADAYLEIGHQHQRAGKLINALALYESASRYGPPNDATIDRAISATRKHLADEFYDHGVRIYRTDVTEAIRNWENGLLYDPEHVKTKLKLKTAYKLRENLSKINGAAHNDVTPIE